MTVTKQPTLLPVASADAPRLGGMPWIGGKNPLAANGLNRWIVGLLPPPTARREYFEVFAGQLGVLLAREPARAETVNDSNMALMSWWQVVRERPDELRGLLDDTPVSRAVYQQAARVCADHDDDGGPVGSLDWAWAVTVLVCQGMNGALRGGGWAFRPGGRGHRPFAARLPHVSARVRDVTLECCDAVDLLHRIAGRSDALIYADPPYPGAARNYYRDAPPVGALDEALPGP